MGDVKEVQSTAEEIRTKPKKLPQYVAALSATIGGFALGTVFSWTSPASAPLKDGSYLNGTPVSLEEESWVGGIMALGAVAICFPVGFLMDAVGRKTTMLLLIIPFTVGWILLIWPQGVEMLYAGRFLVGMAGGAYAVAVPVYTAEISEDEVRGALGSYFELLIVLGVTFVYGLGTILSLFYLTLICALVPLIFGGLFAFMPESPLYYVSKKQDQKAREALRFLRGKHFDVEPELDEIRAIVKMSEAERVSIWNSFSTKTAKKGLLISVSLMVFQQGSGINAVTFYTSDIFRESNVGLNPDVAALILGVVEWIGAFLSTLFVDRWGRRGLLLLSGSAMVVCMAALGIYFHLQDIGHDVSAIGWLPLVSLFVYILVFELGFGPIPWMIVGELFQPHVQGAASAVSVSVNWALTFLVAKFYPDLLISVGSGTTFLIFSGITILGTVCVYLFVIETKGKSVEEIQETLATSKKRKLVRESHELEEQTPDRCASEVVQNARHSDAGDTLYADCESETSNNALPPVITTSSCG